jgi:hypothetical protein
MRPQRSYEALAFDARRPRTSTVVQANANDEHNIRRKSAVSARGRTHPNKSADAILVEYVFRDRSHDV